MIERAVIISQGGALRVDLALGPRGMKSRSAAVRGSVLSREELQRRERENILKAMEQCKGKIYGPDGAAAMLGMKPTTLASRIKKMKLERLEAPSWGPVTNRHCAAATSPNGSKTIRQHHRPDPHGCPDSPHTRLPLRRDFINSP